MLACDGRSAGSPFWQRHYGRSARAIAISLAFLALALPALAADAGKRCGPLPARVAAMERKMPAPVNGGDLGSVYVGGTKTGYYAGWQIETAADGRWIAFTAGH